MSEKEMMQRIAYLESVNDQLTTEIIYLDTLMRTLGFEEGIETIKTTANEIINGGDDY